MIRMQDIGELGYGGVVTLTEWWDSKRITDGTLLPNDVWKKYAFWSYLAIGFPATLVSAFGWWRAQEKWMEHISHGFLYDFPRFVFNTVTAMQAAGRRSNSKAVDEANRIIRQRGQSQKQLEQRAKTDRSYNPAFESVAPHAF